MSHTTSYATREEELEHRARAGVPPRRTDAFRVDYTWQGSPADIHCTATSHADLLTGECTSYYDLFCLALVTAWDRCCTSAGATARMARSYKPLLPGLHDGVLKLETMTEAGGGGGGGGGRASQTPKFIVIPLEEAVLYFGEPSVLAAVISLARERLVDNWNDQPRGEKFALEWEEEVCTHTWHQQQQQDEDDLEPDNSAILLMLNTFTFTNNHKPGQKITASDVQVSR
jgi:hypothetical protein